MALIKHQQLVDDPWHPLEAQQVPLDNLDIIIPWEVFQESPDTWTTRTGRTGVSLTGDVEPEDLEPYLAHIDLIAVKFPKFTDGRGYSQARLLRDRFGFKGELRATGDILRDQLLFLSRCGFDAFELKAGKDAEGALDAFAELPVRYQSAGDGVIPPWKRRRA